MNMKGKNFNYYMSSVAPLENKQLGPVTIKWQWGCRFRQLARELNS